MSAAATHEGTSLDQASSARAARWRRVVLFCAVAFALAGAGAVVIWTTGGLADSQVLVAGTPITVAVVVLPTVYMFSPAAAHVATRAITRQGWAATGLRPRWRQGRWKFLVLALVVPPALMAAGAAVYFAAIPTALDIGAGAARGQIADAAAQAGQPVSISPGLLLLIQVAVALTIAPLLNVAVTVGEELGWRGYLQPQLIALLGVRRGVVATGLVWGAWHWPLIAMGYNYGAGHVGAPWSGMALFLLFTVTAGTVLGWLTVRGGSIWPAALAHGAVNASATLPLLVTAGVPDLLVGPVPIGILAMTGWIVAAALLLWRWPLPTSTDPAGDAASASSADGRSHPQPQPRESAREERHHSQRRPSS